MRALPTFSPLEYQVWAARSAPTGGGSMSMPIKSRLVVTAALSLVGLAALVEKSSGQQPQDRAVQKTSNTPGAAPKAVGPAVIGTIDMDTVLKSYDKYKAQLEVMKTDMLARQKDLMKIQEEGKQTAAQMEKFKPGSPDFKRWEGRISQLKANLQVAQEQASSEFAQREAEMIAAILDDVHKVTAWVAQQHGMSFVVRISRDQINSGVPESVMSAMASTVVYSDPSVDVTNDVVRTLNYQYQRMTNPGGAKPAASAPAQGSGTGGH
jgi:Skp family chaperone for outer membrane proteins